MDGASAWQRFRFVTLAEPALPRWSSPSTLDIINTIRHYDIIGVMTAGGPAGATEVLPVLLYNTAFRGNRFGEAAAIGVLLLIVVLAFAIVYVTVARLDREDGRRDEARARRRASALLWAIALAALAVDAVPVLLDAQHVAQAGARRSSLSPPTFVSAHWSLDAYATVLAQRPVGALFPQQPRRGARARRCCRCVLAALAAYGFTRFFPRGATPFICSCCSPRCCPRRC